MGWFAALLSLDRIAFLWVNANLTPGPVATVFVLLSRSGDWAAVWLVICVLVLLAGRADENARRSVVLALIAILVSEAVTALLKAGIVRPRPEMMLPHVKVLLPAAGYSFPSGHTVRSFAAAVVLSRRLPHWSWLLYLLAGLIGVARVVVGAHFPLDVIGGALIGALIGWLVLIVGGIVWPAEATHEKEGGAAVC